MQNNSAKRYFDTVIQAEGNLCCGVQGSPISWDVSTTNEGFLAEVFYYTETVKQELFPLAADAKRTDVLACLKKAVSAAASWAENDPRYKQ